MGNFFDYTPRKDLKLKDLLDEFKPEKGGFFFNRNPKSAKELNDALLGTMWETLDGDYKPSGQFRVHEAKVNIQHELKIKGIKHDARELESSAKAAYKEANDVLGKITKAETALHVQQAPALIELGKYQAEDLLSFNKIESRVASGKALPFNGSNSHLSKLNEYIKYNGDKTVKQLTGTEAVTEKHLRAARDGMEKWYADRHEALGTLLEEAKERFGKQRAGITTAITELEAKSGIKYIPKASTVAVAENVAKAGETGAADTLKAAEKGKFAFGNIMKNFTDAEKGSKLKAGVGIVAFLDGVRRIFNGFSPGTDENGQPKATEMTQVAVGALEAAIGAGAAMHMAV